MKKVTRVNNELPYANLSSLSTSCTEGASAPVPGVKRLSSKDNARDLAGAQKSGGFEGWGPNPEKVRARRVGARRVGGPKISRFFFPLPPQNSFFSSLSGVFSWNFGGV